MKSSVCEIFPAHRVFSGSFFLTPVPQTQDRMKRIHTLCLCWCWHHHRLRRLLFTNFAKQQAEREEELVRKLMIVDDSGMSHTRRMLMPTNKPSARDVARASSHKVKQISRHHPQQEQHNRTQKNSQSEFGFTMFLCVEIWINSIFLSRLCFGGRSGCSGGGNCVVANHESTVRAFSNILAT